MTGGWTAAAAAAVLAFACGSFFTAGPVPALRKHGRRFFAMNRRKLAFFALRDRGLKAAKEMDAAKKARLRG